MRITYSQKALEAIEDATPAVRNAFFKQVINLERDLLYPSLNAKKYDERRNLWQARVNRDWRFYFTIRSDAYHIEDVIPHPK